MKQCPICKRDLKDQLSFCPYDGQALIEKLEETDSLVGILLDDKYRLEQMVGKGGMGTVYKATHIRMENIVAVKVLHPHLASDKVAVERFRREARAAAQIRHPNAVTVTDFGVTRDDDVAYLVMEFLEGEDLRDRIRQKKQLDYKETIQILSQVCSAVHTAHTKGIIHRDLKPDNIWILKTEDRKDLVKVLDFGIAKLKVSSEGNTLTQKGMIVGTPYYMSPEQCRGEELDSGSDIYSLGIILYEMLTGRVPFEASTPLAIVLKHNNEAPKPLRQWRPDIPEQVEKVVLRALAKSRKDRQNSAPELAEDFERAASVSPESNARRGAVSASRSTIAAKSYLPQEKPDQVSQVAQNITKAYDDKVDLKSDHEAKQESQPYAVRSSDSGLPATRLQKILPDAVPQLEKNSSPNAEPLIQSDSNNANFLTGNKRIFFFAAAVFITIIGIIIWLSIMRTNSSTAQQNGDANKAEPGGSAVPEGMVLVKGSTFIMGTDDATARPQWKPAHPVSVRDFYLDVHEVTNEQYDRFVRQTGHPAPPHWKNGTFPPGESKLPVYNVSWNDAQDYAEWAGKRLPKEAEWEYAARGTDNRIYPWGNEWSDQLSNSGEDGRGIPVAVGSYPRGNSPFGITDMAGNVSEWVADDFILYPGSGAKPDPGFKVFRGGSYKNYKSDSTTFARWYDVASVKFVYVGFRCSKDVSK